jgi:hypothetical protein
MATLALAYIVSVPIGIGCHQLFLLPNIPGLLKTLFYSLQAEQGGLNFTIFVFYLQNTKK